MPMPEIVELYQYITPDGRTYTFRDDERRFLMSIAGEGMPPIEYLEQQGPFQHGSSVVDFRLRPRVLQMLYRERLSSRQRYWDARGGATMVTAAGARKQVAGLLDAIRPNRQGVGQVQAGRLRKRLPDGSLRDLYVWVQEGPGFQPSEGGWDEWAYAEVLRFYAPDPVWIDPVLQSASWTLSPLDQLVFTATFPIVFGTTTIASTRNLTYLGTWLSYPVIYITGPITNPTVTNSTTGEVLALTYTISAGEQVTIDCSYGAKTIINNSGTNLIGYLSTDSDLATFHLEPHPGAALGVNSLTFVGSDCSVATEGRLTYYTRFIGI